MIGVEKTRVRAAINRIRKQLRQHPGCRCCQLKYAWLTATAWTHRDSADELLMSLVVVGDASRQMAPECDCCRFTVAKLTAELFTLSQHQKRASA